MGKGGDVKRGGSSRFSPAMRQTGGDSDGILDKSSKSEKLRKLSCVGEMDQSSQSTSTNTSSKRLKLPKKFFDDDDIVNRASVPRKLRSAMKKRHCESPNPRNRIRRFQMPSNDRKKKLKVDVHELQSVAEEMTKDEEEVMAALVSMAGMSPGNDTSNEINLNNEASETEASTLQPEDLVRGSMQMETPNETTKTVDIKQESKDAGGGNNSRKRCASHVYICHLITDLQATEGKEVNSDEEPKQQVPVDAKPDKASNEASTAHGMPFQDQRHACAVAASSSLSVVQNHASVPVMRLSAAALEQVPPYFGSPLYDPSQWLQPVFPKQETWMSRFIPGARYQNWLNAGRETMPHHPGSYVGMSYKMQFGHHRSSRYDENGGSFFVDSSPTLKLTLR